MSQKIFLVTAYSPLPLMYNVAYCYISVYVLFVVVKAHIHSTVCVCFLLHSGMKTVISELSPSSHALVASICKKIVGRLTSAIAKVVTQIN